MGCKHLFVSFVTVVLGGLAFCSLLAAEDKAKDSDKPAKKSGTVVGAITAKGDNWIDVKADGEEKGRRYFPHWRGGAPKDGGGLDKDMLKTIKELKVGQRVRLEWEFQERPRVVKVEVIKAKDKSKDSDSEKK